MIGFVSGVSLFVEGRVDAQIVSALAARGSQRITVLQEGAKYGLRNKVKYAREGAKAGQQYFYLRDRDFDFFDVDMAEQVPRAVETFGWHWCRHEIENYLLEPDILHRYLLSVVTKREVSIEEVHQAICEAAATIRYYQMARWTIGVSRRNGLPYPSNLTTRPEHVEEFKLPNELESEASLNWTVESTKTYLQRVSTALDKREVMRTYERYEQMFSAENCQNVEWVLHHFSGKDLFAALKPWMEGLGIQRNTKKFVEEDLTPWVTRNMDDLLPFISEWQSFLDILEQL